MVVFSPEWSEYQLLDSGNGLRLERFGKFTVVRPDPQAIWKVREDTVLWESADAVFAHSNQKGDKGIWEMNKVIPDKWLMSYGDIKLWVKLTPFKHTGVFPEQAVQWEWMEERIKIQDSRLKNKNEQLNILNLFAYTGIASLVCANAGARVTHVDASRPAISWARDNQLASGLEQKPIRWILDDVNKFVQREIKRGVRYDGIIMDPPIYGHGPNGERWEFHEQFPILLDLCRQVLSSRPLFIIVNAYAISASALMLENMLKDLSLPGKIESGELALKEINSDRKLSTGIFARWSHV